MERIAITARLAPGAEEGAKQLIEAGPPFDPAIAGLAKHSVFVGNDMVVFVFEGVGITQRLSEMINDPVLSAAFGAWAPVLADQPKLAHEAFHWQAKEESTT